MCRLTRHGVVLCRGRRATFLVRASSLACTQTPFGCAYGFIYQVSHIDFIYIIKRLLYIVLIPQIEYRHEPRRPAGGAAGGSLGPFIDHPYFTT